MAFSAATLKTELQTDPLSLGYATLITKGQDNSIASLLNSLTGPGAATVTRNDVMPKEIIQAIASTDFTAATALQVAKLQLLFLAAPLDMTLSNLQASMKAIFSGASAGTITALNAVCTRTGSRAETLFGTGFIATSDQVGAAR